MDDIAIVRAIHVISVVIWIGGVAMVTTVVLPAVRRLDTAAKRVALFEAVENRFVWQARIATLLVAASGFYMVDRLDLWARFRSVQFWWMHAMVLVWLVFTIILFVGEPLVMRARKRRRGDERAGRECAAHAASALGAAGAERHHGHGGGCRQPRHAARTVIAAG